MKTEYSLSNLPAVFGVVVDGMEVVVVVVVVVAVVVVLVVEVTGTVVVATVEGIEVES